MSSNPSRTFLAGQVAAQPNFPARRSEGALSAWYQAYAYLVYTSASHWSRDHSGVVQSQGVVHGTHASSAT